MLTFNQNEAKVRCECGEEITAPTQDFELETECYEHGSEGMGVDTVYTFSYEFTCPKCGRDITITVSADEYPEGVCNYSDPSISEGAEFIGEAPSVAVDHTPPEDER
mgnify:CR=1 FL=1